MLFYRMSESVNERVTAFVPFLGLLSLRLCALPNSNVLVFILSYSILCYVILFYQFPLEARLLPNERQKGGKSALAEWDGGVESN